MKIELAKSIMNYKIIGEGIPVLLVHGFPLNHKVMEGAYEPIFKFTQGFKRIYVDLPAMGDSESKDIKTSDDIFHSLCEFVDKIIGDEKFILIGQSYGGYMSLGLVTVMAERIAGLSLLCPMVNPDYDSRKLPELKVYYRDEEFLSTLSKIERETFEEMSVVSTKYTYERYLKDIVPGLEKANYDILEKLKVIHYALSFDPQKEISKFDKATLFLVGKQDNVVGYVEALKLERKFENATSVVVNGAGHGLQYEQVGTFEVMTKKWLELFNT